jgi:uncharacterized protein YueI
VKAMKSVDDYLKEGIYGARETKPDERRKYLGTLRERIVLALSKGQVMKRMGLMELEEAMMSYPDAQLLFNGNMRSTYFKKYKKLAIQKNISYTTITKKDKQTEYGLILTCDHAIEKDNIYLNEDKEVKSSEEKGMLKSFFKGLFTDSQK